MGDLVNINRSTACRIIRRVVLALNGRLHRYVKFSIKNDMINSIKQGFHVIAGFPNVVACVDGIHAPIQAPTEKRRWQYVNWKGGHSINVQLMCDHELRIYNCVVIWNLGSRNCPYTSPKISIFHYLHFFSDRHFTFNSKAHARLESVIMNIRFKDKHQKIKICRTDL